MEVSITQPLGFTQLGSRTNNEDTLFPDPKITTTQQQWFMVCDGVGGAERGEVASQLAVMEFDLYFRTHPVAEVTEDYIQQALAFVQDKFDEYVADNPQAESMGTTLTLVYRHTGGITVAHLGDSRVYLVRKGAIAWRTDDHSYVNELVKAGVLNPEEARRHPQRNVITRAIQSGDKRVKADVQLLNDLEPGDYLFMCTDGILERISDELLEKTLGSADSNDEKLRTLLACCYGQTRDNFTAYLIQVASVSNKVATAARVALPTYSRPETDDEEDAVTLIGVPRPEALPSYASLTTQNDLPSRREAVVPVAEMRPSAEVQPAQSPKLADAKPSGMSRWVPWVLVMVLLGGGTYGLWYKYGYMLEKKSVTEADQASVPTPERDPPAKSVTNSEPVLTGEPAPQATDNVTDEAADKNIEGNSPRETISKGTKTGMSGELTRVDSSRYLKLEVMKDKRGRLGLRYMNGKEIFEPQFDAIRLNEFKRGLMPVVLNGKKKMITLMGVLYDEMGTASEKCKRIPVKKGDTWAYLNFNGNQIIKPGRFVKARSFDEKDCTAEVKDLSGKVYRIDPEGKQQR